MVWISQGQDYFLLSLFVPPPLATSPCRILKHPRWGEHCSSSSSAKPYCARRSSSLLPAGTSYFPKSGHAFWDMSVLRHKPAACSLSHWRPPCWHLANSGKVNTEPRESTFRRNSWGLSKRYKKDDCVFFCFTVVVFLGFALRKWNSLENKQTLPDSSLGITFSCITSTIFTLFEASIDSLGAFKDTQAKVSEDSGPLQSHSGHCPGTWLLPNAPVLPVDRFW